MRDKLFITARRGGGLSIENHKKLMRWAIFCFERVLSYYGEMLDKPILNAVKVAELWQLDQCSTGDAINASQTVHALARTIESPVSYAVARAVGQGVATAHMADHCIGAALYSEKALKLSGRSYDKERIIQLSKLQDLPDDLIKLINTTLKMEAKGLGL